METSELEQDIAYRRIHGMEGRMPASHRRAPRCAWLGRLCQRLCHCFTGDTDESRESTPRSRALENQNSLYEAPPVPSTSAAVAQQQRSAQNYNDDVEAGQTLLPKSVPSSAPLPRPGHSRNNSSASAPAPGTTSTAAAAAAATTHGAAGPGGTSEPLSRLHRYDLQPSAGSASAAVAPSSRAAAAGMNAPAGGAESTSARPSHRRAVSHGEARHRQAEFTEVYRASESTVVAAPGAAVAVGVAAAVVAGSTATPASTASGRPGALYGPVQDEEDDFCPTCLEPYSDDNPKIFTGCGHHFHLPCIYAWLERRDTCPMCGARMEAPGL
ncbi:hypothetical protein Agub_g5170 [Astrephomene gubernaculifera]|uniref:RING-type E3 ubiquitin transferase n=1 Tax=Astrephomene gubernaculifera TaxID=47775 RepID=A0AAD3HKS9_9CHLO|nr:hypothetical protein Agub_g5170 [Astrephomene gubernaculifera]